MADYMLDDSRAHLRLLYLYNNKWHCTCELRWLRQLVGKSNVTYDLESKFTKCASPDSVQVLERNSFFLCYVRWKCRECTCTCSTVCDAVLIAVPVDLFICQEVPLSLSR